MVISPVLQRHPDDSWTLADPRTVSQRTHRVFLALADAILPASPRTETTLGDVTRHALVCLQYMPRSSAMALVAGMRLLNWAPLWRFRGLRPLTRLSRGDVHRHLVAVTQSRWLPVRALMYGPLGLFMSTYFDQDYAHRALDYDPVPFVEERIELRRKWLEGEEPGADQEIHHLPVVPP
ncbi:MAG: hypothetical protein OEM15_08915 [Myxococcales bacterium]|nr:hypothetical protein [Myxococcales bacterium]MDH3484613.1 hypothetical protein [Myxococcales bacterium]